jgi:putative ABC transport system permease protein
MLTAVLTRLRGLLQRRRAIRELDDELRFHVAMETESNIRRGMSPTEAQRAARIALGGLAQTKEAVRDVRTLSVERLWQDARYTARVMRKRPLFTALAVTTLALGIGVNTTSIAVAYGILGRPLPYAEPSRVIILNLLFADGGDMGFSPSVLQDWLSRLRTLETAAGYYRRDVTVRFADRGTVVPAAYVTGQFFDVLGTPTDSGELPSSRETAGVVVGHRWISQFVRGAPSTSIGVPLSISDVPSTIAGVLPSDFAFPDDEIGVWLPSSASTPGTKAENSGYSKIVARLKPGVTIDQVRDDAERVRRELEPPARRDGPRPEPTIVSVEVLGESVVGGLRRLLMVTLAGALLVLLVACANVATLFIGRDVTRQREFAARMALGATAAHLVRSVLVETALTALMGSILGVGMGAAMLRIFVHQASGSVSGLHRVDLGVPTAIAIVAVTVIVSVICAAVPAWHAARADFSPFVRDTAVSRPRVWRLRSALVVAQIALSCVLLIGAGLLTRTVSVLLRQDQGFRPNGALEAKIVLSDKVLFDGVERTPFFDGLLARVRRMPGVQHAGLGSTLPPRPALLTMRARMVDTNRDEARFFSVATATPGYLRALGARFVHGRDFDEIERQSRAAVVILSESTARFFFPDGDAIGRTFIQLPAIFGMAQRASVVGVVSDIKYQGLDSPAPSAVYIPWDLRPLGSGYLVVRTHDGDPMRLAPDIRRAARELDPAVPVPEVQSLEATLAQSIAHRRVRALPAIGFGALSLCLACVSVLATLWAFVGERRRDLAIRAALGASPVGLTWTVVSAGLVLTAIGLAIGLGLGGAAARSLSSLVYGVSPYDALTFVGTTVVIGGGAALVTYVAALRARSVDPLRVLKSD